MADHRQTPNEASSSSTFSLSDETFVVAGRPVPPPAYTGNVNYEEHAMRLVMQIELADHIPLKEETLRQVLEISPGGHGGGTGTETKPETGTNGVRIGVGAHQRRLADYKRVENNPVLHPVEQRFLDELKAAAGMLKNPYERLVQPPPGGLLLKVINITEAIFVRLIRMAKCLAGFRRLGQNDQIALLKSSIVEMMSLHTVVNYDWQSQKFRFIDDKNSAVCAIHLDALKIAQIDLTGQRNFFYKYNVHFRDESTVTEILIAMILFRPYRTGMAFAKPEITREFLNYSFLLRRYLQVRYQGDICRAKSIYIRLMALFEEHHQLHFNILRTFYEMDPDSVEPLLVELFDLKS